VQDEISGAVVEQLKVKLLGAAPKAQVVNTQAYALLLQARAVSRQGSDESFNSSIDLYKQALKIDPTIADAWVELSQAYESRATTGNGLMESDLLLSREVLQRALALNPNSPGVYCRLASLAEVLDNDLPRDAKYLNQALRLAPDDEGVLRSAAILSGSLGRLEQLLEIRQFLIRRDPARAGNYSSLGYVFERLGRWDEATASLRKALTLSPSRASTHYSIAMILLAQGQAQLALAEMNEEPETSAWRLIGFPLVWHALGDKAKSDAALAELIRKSERGAAFQVAEAYAYRGEPDKAFEWLGKAVRYRDPGLRLMVTDTLLVNLHADARWLPFLRKIGRAPEQLAAIQLDVKLPAQ
jgi:tetratricopeptide (TPR) repeat protein